MWNKAASGSNPPFLPQQLARPHEKLRDFRQTLFALVYQKFRPVGGFASNSCQSEEGTRAGYA